MKNHFKHLTIDKINQKLCTGCGACSLICPQKAIKMEENHLGFLYPKIDKKNCISCGLCFKRCHLIQKTKNCTNIVTQYAAQHKDIEILNATTSGGIADIISKYIITKGGYVCGCIIDQNFNIKHIITNDLSEAELFRKSKYVQSTSYHNFPEIKKLLNANKLVCFISTPCQVNGLLSYLGKDYENLLTIDFICHGVPSNKLFKKYLFDVSKHYNQEVKSIDFRTKKNGWATQMEIILKNQALIETPQKNPFLKFFLTNYALRLSCFKCKYRKIPQPADITIADFWHIKQEEVNFPIANGCSKIILNTLKGEKIFESINDKINYVAIPLNETSISIRKPLGYHYFWNSFFKGDSYIISKKIPTISEKTFLFIKHYYIKIRNKLKSLKHSKYH